MCSNCVSIYSEQGAVLQGAVLQGAHQGIHQPTNQPTYLPSTPLSFFLNLLFFFSYYLLPICSIKMFKIISHFLDVIYFCSFVVHSGQFKMYLLPSPPLSPFLHYTLSRAILLSIPFKNLRLLQYWVVIHLCYWTIYPLQFCKTLTFSLKRQIL